jgi:hypothetical protein
VHPGIETQKKKTSPWLYVGLGCSGLLVLGVLVIGGLIWFAARKMDDFEKGMNDPVVRRQEAQRILGTQAFPEGYDAQMSLSVPLVMNLVLLGSEEGLPGTGTVGAGNGFLFIHMLLEQPPQERRVRDYVEGRDVASPGALAGNDFRLDVTETLGRGELPFEGHTVRYVSQRGTFTFSSDKDGVEDERVQGLSTLVLFECPGSPRSRLGLWYTPDPAPDAKEGAPALEGTPADKAAVERFMSHFHPCQKG